MRSLSLSGSVTLPGASARHLGWLDGGSVFVLSSRFEGYPNVLVEAMAHGFPVVAFDCDFGPGEIVADGETGRLVRETDAAALAGAIEAMILDPDLARAMGDRARSVASAHGAEAITRQWLSVFRSAAPGAP